MSSSPLLVRPAPGPYPDGTLLRVTPESAGWRHVGFEVCRLQQGASLTRDTAGSELCVVLLSGRADLTFAGREWPDVGGREAVFDGPPYALHVPPGGVLTMAATTPVLEAALCWAPAATGVDPVLITPGDVRVSSRGVGLTEREIRDILMEDRPAASLLVTEVITPAGHWSSWPPHKHDTDDQPRETYLEETYYHRLRRRDGFAVQRVYDREGTLDETLAVSDGEVVLVPRGFHPVSATPGYDLYYLNVMAGPVRRWLVTVDPAHHWQLASQ
jgi:5-deoxy-glucuronate isomerase